MKQIYKTPIRELIQEYFGTNHHPSSLEDISKFLESKALKCEFSTVFRQVKSMVKENILREFYLENKSKMYEIASHHDHFHYHIICNNCNKVYCEELREKEFTQLKSILKLEKLTVVSELELKIKGVCKDCK
jgi:Fe2+ or Zn2+ uptake regulation protein